MSRQRKEGFTLIELVSAVAILIIALAISMPLFGPVIARTRLTSAVEKVAMDLRRAQGLAVTEGILHRLFKDGTGRYRLERETTPGNWAEVFEWYNLSNDYEGSTLQSIKSQAGADLTNGVVFNSQGVVTSTTSFPITLTIATPSGAGTVEVMRTGAVRVP
jgi:Tfp pilus assembly protein FimT